jgi:hypothetical protein
MPVFAVNSLVPGACEKAPGQGGWVQTCLPESA